MSTEKQLTVKELIELLKKEDPEALVWHEGCDCFGKADGVKHIDSPKQILITRSN